MRRSRTAALALLAVLLAAAATAAAPAHGADVAFDDPGFDVDPVAQGLTGPTNVAFAPDGRIFVTEQRGVLKVVDPLTPRVVSEVLDLSAHVNSHHDRGLIGLALDSEFASNGYVYLLYVYDDDAVDDDGPKTSRLTRITVGPGTQVLEGERTILGTVGTAPCPAPGPGVDCIPADSETHAIGTVRSAPDGTLWLGSGDGSNPATIDTRALRTYDENSFAGKIIHVDREGRGLTGHPFCPADADLAHVCTKLYAKGFRNPFRFHLRPGADGPVVGDVGSAKWEEIDLPAPGRSYGWPCYEGPDRTSGFEEVEDCKARYAAGGDDGPAYAYLHPVAPEPNSSSVVAGPRYAGDQYPAGFHGAWIFGDYARGELSRYRIDAGGRIDGVERFATGAYGVVAIEAGPGGDLYLVSYGYGPSQGSIERISYAPGNQDPRVTSATATPSTGPAPLDVELSSTADDPDGDALTFSWDFGDGSAPGAGRTVSHRYAREGAYTARVTVSDGRGRSDVAEVEITVGNPPELTIEAPVPGARYRGGEPVGLRVRASDPEDGELAGNAIGWDVRLDHAGHQHPLTTPTGSTASFTPLVDHDADSHYLITATAQDSTGLQTTKRVRIDPETVTLTIGSDPPGASISYGAVSSTLTRTQPAAVGFRTSVSAPAEFLDDAGRRWRFDRWSQGGARLHDGVIPDRDVTWTAIYTTDVPPVAPTAPPADGTPLAPLPTPFPAAPAARRPVAVSLDPLFPRRARTARALAGTLTGTSERLRLSVALSRPWKRSRTHCQFWDARRGRFGSPTRCTNPALFAARLVRKDGRWRWRASLRGRLPSGRYALRAVTRDAAGATIPSRVAAAR